ncbi:MAG: hypothetical protein NTY61_01085 [Candidatus Parcubacteria bacterium]|nr:hypothetical protein [Candidatus Parcubacteria bacterium]
MKCQEVGCDGEIDWDTFITIRTECVRFVQAFPCSKCGRLHWVDGEVVPVENGEGAFLHGRRVVYKKFSGGSSGASTKMSCKIKRGC